MKKTSLTQKKKEAKALHCLSCDDGHTYITSGVERKEISETSQRNLAREVPFTAAKEGHDTTEAIASSRWGPPDKKDLQIKSMRKRGPRQSRLNDSRHRLTKRLARLLETMRLVSTDDSISARKGARVKNKLTSSMDKRSVSKRERTRRMNVYGYGCMSNQDQMTLTLSVKARVLTNKFCRCLGSTLQALARQSAGRCAC